MTSNDRVELIRLQQSGSVRVICDVSGQRGGIDNFGHVELAAEGTLLWVTPFNTIDIQDTLKKER